MWADQAAKLHRSGPAVARRTAEGRPVLSFRFTWGKGNGHAYAGGARNRRGAASTARTIRQVTATSASWNVVMQAWRTAQAPISTSLSRRLVSEQSAIASGKSMQRMKVAGIAG